MRAGFEEHQGTSAWSKRRARKENTGILGTNLTVTFEGRLGVKSRSGKDTLAEWTSDTRANSRGKGNDVSKSYDSVLSLFCHGVVVEGA